MKKITLSLIIVSMLCFVAYGQQKDYAFKVIANKGANQVKVAEGWQPLKPGASLKETDELLVGENAYLGLVSSSGKPVELKQAGPYKVSALMNQTKAGSSVLNKYTDFILSSNAEGKKNRLSATGAVHRATDHNAIRLMLPETNANLYNSTAVLNWESEKTQGPYIVTLKNLFEDELAKIETTDPYLVVDLSPYAKESTILIEVKSKDNHKLHSRQHTIQRLPASEQVRIKQLLTEVAEATDEESALTHYLMAGFYEENKLFIDAIASHKQAIKLAPDVEMYQEAYEEFLIRNGLKK
jgi:hypothetical protein